MLARAQVRLVILLAASNFGFLPLSAQVNGVPAPVTSFGFGARENQASGIRPSVTSTGQNGYGNWSFLGNCCSIFSLPAQHNSATASGRHHRQKDRSNIPVGVLDPVYVPYAVPYAEDAQDEPVDDSAGEDVSASYVEPDDVEPPNDGRPSEGRPTQGLPTHTRNSGAKTADLVQTQAPVVAQPSTVLVFKDGHQSDVLNYAIVGETLFDFSTERTHKILLGDLDLTATQKANDDRGVDFEIPADTSLQ